MTRPGSRPDDKVDDTDTRFEDGDPRPLDVSESLDSDDLGSTDAGLDPLDDSWDPPDRPSGALRHGNTRREERNGESLDDYLTQELPDVDPYREAELRESGAVLDADVYDATSAPRSGGPTGDLTDPVGELVDDGNDMEARRADVERRTSQPDPDGSRWPPSEDSTLYVDPSA